MTAAYAFTDYRFQGRTIPYVINHRFTTYRHPNLSLFNLYVALSQSSGHDSIKLLPQYFKDELFRASHDPGSIEGLENLDKITQEWYQRLFLGQAIGQE